MLRWTLPQLYTDGARLESLPRLEVYRAFFADAAVPEETFAKEARVAYVIPEQLVDTFLHGEIVVFLDVLGPAALREQAGRTAAYAVRATNARGQSAGFSNRASLRVYPTAAPIARIQTHVSERAIELRWEAPSRTTSGTPLEAIAGYEVYRSETGAEGSFALHGTTATARYEDTQFRFGARYFYFVRTLAQFGGDTVESDSSATTEVTPRDVFPPPAPAHLIAVAEPERVDLTWDASPAEDLAGYYVYRSEQPGSGYARLHQQPLRAQSFVDSSARAGKRYYYVVTAVDTEKNESPFSGEVEATPLPRE